LPLNDHVLQDLQTVETDEPGLPPDQGPVRSQGSFEFDTFDTGTVPQTRPVHTEAEALRLGEEPFLSQIISSHLRWNGLTFYRDESTRPARYASNGLATTPYIPLLPARSRPTHLLTRFPDSLSKRCRGLVDPSLTFKESHVLRLDPASDAIS
jgi:hypothetical protein